MRHELYFAAAVFLLAVMLTQACRAQLLYEPPRKKIVEFGWHSPSVKQYQTNMAKYEDAPFDGTSLKLSEEIGNGYIFKVDTWANVSDELKQEEEAVISSIKKSDKLTHNFLVLYGASEMDWFSDADWAVVEDQLRFALRMAQKAHCKGILWDAEPYGNNPWQYNEQEKSKKYSFDDYSRQVRKRGEQFMEILQDGFPGLIVFSLRELSDWQHGSPFALPLLPLRDWEMTTDTIQHSFWGLHIPFYVGMLEGIKHGTQLIEGNEEAYYYTSQLEYYKIRTTMAVDAKGFVPPELWEKHSCFSRIGHAISTEYISGQWLKMSDLSSFPKRLTGQGLVMTDENRNNWFEHNTYYAMLTSDEYSWLYTGDMDWWTNRKFTEGFKEAFIRARAKVAANEPLGFAVEEMTRAAQDKAEKVYGADSKD
jgi:hypothetical protein